MIRLPYVNFDLEHLQTLLAVVDAGSFEDAAIDLGITPSAVSQRIKSLESRIGAILLVRARPVTPTAQGARVLAYARQITLLGREMTHEIKLSESSSGRSTISVGVNADSLATWLAPVLGEMAQRGDMGCELIRADEHHSSQLLKQGNVSGVVTTRAEAIQGCISEYLGTMRYRAVAARSLLVRHGCPQPTADDLAALPVVNFDREDPLQHNLLEQVTGRRRWKEALVHYVPDSWQFAASVEAGLGWGMLPDIQLGKLRGLQLLDPDWDSKVCLYWQRWTISSQALDDMGQMLAHAARAAGLSHA